MPPGDTAVYFVQCLWDISLYTSQNLAANEGASPAMERCVTSPSFRPRKYAHPFSLSSVTTSVTEVGANARLCHIVKGERDHRWARSAQVIPKWQKNVTVSVLSFSTL